jgi:hypothetical protein
MRTTRDKLPILFGEDPAVIRGADWAPLGTTSKMEFFVMDSKRRVRVAVCPHASMASQLTIGTNSRSTQPRLAP